MEEREVMHLRLAQGLPLDEPGANGVTHEVSGRDASGSNLLG